MTKPTVTSDQKFLATVVAAEFVPYGDPYRDDMDDEPRPSGTYFTVRLDDPEVKVHAGRVIIEYLKSP